MKRKLQVERQKHEAEAIVERTWREREVERTMGIMQAHIDNLMSMVKANRLQSQAECEAGITEGR